MTALCGGGASQAKPGVGTTVVMTGAAIAALLNNVPTVWAVIFGTLLAGVTYDLSTMCTTDPPALPTMTGADMVDLVAGPAGGAPYFAAVAKFYDFVKYWAWFQFCECSAVVTPAPAAAPAAPSGLPQLNPPVSPPLTAAPCIDVVLRPDLRNWQYNMAGAHYYDFTTQVMGNLPRVTVTGAITGDNTASQLPAGAAGSGTLKITISGYTDNAANHDTKVAAWFYTAAGGNSNAFVAAVQTFNAAPQSATFSIPSAAASVQLFVAQNAGQTGSVVVTAEIVMTCATVGSVQQPCCPPDIIASGLMTQILQAVTLIQRQAVPFAYVPGAAHATLSGHGQLAVQGLLGVKVLFTTMPAYLGAAGDDPSIVFDAGWVAVGDVSGWLEKVRIRTSPFLWLPRDMSLATIVGYELNPGVVVTLTELVREP